MVLLAILLWVIDLARREFKAWREKRWTRKH
jgi:hypothetical protein